MYISSNMLKSRKKIDMPTNTDTNQHGNMHNTIASTSTLMQ